MKNIIFFIPNLQYGGTERVSSLLSGELSKIHNVEVVVLQNRCENLKLHKNVALHVLSRQEIGKVRFKYLKLLISLYRYFSKKGSVPLHLIAMGEVPIFLSAIISLFFKNLVLISAVRNYESAHFSKKIIGRIKANIFKKSLLRAKRIIVNSEYIKHDLENNFKIFNKIDIIFNPVLINNSMISKRRKANNWKILNVGRLEKQKGQQDIIKICEKISSRELNYKFDIVGSGTERDKINKMIDKHNLTNIKVHPHTQKIKKFYDQADLFLLTSYWEGMPNVLLEAMSHGVPVISYDCMSGPREILGDGNYGKLIPVGDTDAAVREIKNILTGSSYNELSKKAIKRAKDFQLSKIINDWNRIL